MTLRNPSAEANRFALDVAKAFELPDDAVHEFTARSPWQSDQGQSPVRLRGGSEHTVNLAPFEVVTLEATPMRRARRGLS